MRTRGWLTFFFVAGAAILLGSLFLGTRMGDRVVGQFGGGRVDLAPTEIPTAVPSDARDARRVFWKRAQVVSAATDPAFPDPRITPAPTATPRPITPSPKPSPEPTERPLAGPTLLLTPVPAPPSADLEGSPAALPSETPPASRPESSPPR